VGDRRAPVTWRPGGRWASVVAAGRLPELLLSRTAPLVLQPFPLLPSGDPGLLSLLPGPVALLQTSPEPLEGDLPVPVLTAFVPGRDHDPGGVVGEADAALRRVLVLSTLASGTEGVDPALTEKFVVVLGDSGSGRRVGRHGQSPQRVQGRANRAGTWPEPLGQATPTPAPRSDLQRPSTLEVHHDEFAGPLAV